MRAWQCLCTCASSTTTVHCWVLNVDSSTHCLQNTRPRAWVHRHEAALCELGVEGVEDLLLVEDSDLMVLGLTTEAISQFKVAVTQHCGEE